MSKQRLQLTWYNKDMALIPTETGKYGYMWVDPRDPRYCETHTLVFDERIEGKQTPKSDELSYSERADLELQDDNLLILGESGDVLEALTRVPELAKKYVGNVKQIYIDPPFNTANSFASYEDNLEHSIWLTMMRDRLLNMKKLLSDDGSIWVHLDASETTEAHRMHLLLDEIFGSNNFVAEVVWQKADSPRRGDGFSVDQDAILVFRKSESFVPNMSERTAADNARFSNPDNDSNGPWFDGDPTANHGDGSGGMCYAIQSPLTGKMLRPAHGRNWVRSQAHMFEAMNAWCPYRYENLHDAEWRANNEGVSLDKVSDDVCAIVLDVSLDEARRLFVERKGQGDWPDIIVRSTGGLGKKSYVPENGSNPRTWWTNAEVGHNRSAKAELKALFPGVVPFSTPKPERLLERIIHIGSNPGDIVLDCFAGSGTTAAVAQKMGRRWVTCELLESNFKGYTLPRLTKVVNDEDPGGITSTDGERVAVDGAELPDNVSAKEAYAFNSVLNKVLKKLADDAEEDGDEASIESAKALKKSKEVKRLKELTKTEKTKTVINWRGGGGFQVAHLSPACFDYDPELDRTVLTDAATGETLVRSVAANLGFKLLEYGDWNRYDGTYFEGYRGDTLLKVWEGVVTNDDIDWLASRLHDGQTMVIAATGAVDGVRKHLRHVSKGSRIVLVPDEVFSYSKEA